MTIEQLVGANRTIPIDTSGVNYQRGIECGGEHKDITIVYNNFWEGRARNGRHTSSYERIGYHTGSVSFIAGVVDSGCPVYVKRNDKLEWIRLERK